MVESLGDSDGSEVFGGSLKKRAARGSEPHGADFRDPSAAHALVNGVVLAVDRQQWLALLARFRGDELASGDQTFFIRQANGLPGLHGFVGGFESGNADDGADDEVDVRMRGHAN